MLLIGLLALFLCTLGHFKEIPPPDTTTEPNTGTTSEPNCDNGQPALPGRLDGKRTICSLLRNCLDPREEFNINVIYPEHPEWWELRPIALLFVTEPTENGNQIQILRETDIIPDCQTISSVNANERPKWVTQLLQKDELSKKLQSHCFSKIQNVTQVFSYAKLYKVVLEKEENNNPVYEKKAVALVLPNEREYMILKRSSDMDRVCTCMTQAGGCGSFGQQGLVGNQNLTAVLNRLAG